MKNKKAQSAVEFAALMAIMFLIFTIFFYAVSTKMVDIQRDNDAAALEDLGSYVQNELRLATIAEDGYQRVFEIPSSLSGRDYNINITRYGGFGHTDLVIGYVNYSMDYEFVLPIGNVTGSIDKNKNTSVKVVKRGNLVVVST